MLVGGLGNLVVESVLAASSPGEMRFFGGAKQDLGSSCCLDSILSIFNNSPLCF